MSYCDSCTDPLVITAGDTISVNGEGSSRGGVNVVDDIELICGHHFHRSCFGDAYTAGRKTTCPQCYDNIIDASTNKLLVTKRSERGEQIKYDLGSELENEEEEAYGCSPQVKQERAFLELCATGNDQAISGMLSLQPSLIASQDFVTAQTCLHVAVRHHRFDTVILLLAKGADRNAKDHSGKTFIDLAWQFGASEDILARLGRS